MSCRIYRTPQNSSASPRSSGYERPSRAANSAGRASRAHRYSPAGQDKKRGNRLCDTKKGGRLRSALGECAAGLHSEIRGDQNERDSGDALCSLLDTGGALGVARASARKRWIRSTDKASTTALIPKPMKDSEPGDGGDDRGEPHDRFPPHRDKTQLHGAARRRCLFTGSPRPRTPRAAKPREHRHRSIGARARECEGGEGAGQRQRHER